MGIVKTKIESVKVSINLTFDDVITLLREYGHDIPEDQAIAFTVDSSSLTAAWDGVSEESWHYRDGGGGKNEPAPKPDPEPSSEPPAMRIKVGDTVTYETGCWRNEGVVSAVSSQGVVLDSGRSIPTVAINGISRA